MALLQPGKTKAKLEFIQQFVKFGIVGVFNTSIDFGVYILLTRGTEFFSHHIYTANTIAFASAATFSLVANKYWTFGHLTAVTLKEALRFYATASIGFLLGTLTLFLLVSQLGVYDLYAKVCAVGVTVIWNFLITKFWVFQKKENNYLNYVFISHHSCIQ